MRAVALVAVAEGEVGEVADGGVEVAERHGDAGDAGGGFEVVGDCEGVSDLWWEEVCVMLGWRGRVEGEEVK